MMSSSNHFPAEAKTMLANIRTSYMEAVQEPILPSPRADGVESSPSNGPAHWDRKMVAALLAEFIGLMLFQLYGGDAPESTAAYGNGMTLMVLVYCTANISGGHLNPAVTLTTILTGHMHWTRGVLYMAAQFLGGIFGALLNCGLLPDVHVGMGKDGPGCFTHLTGRTVRVMQLFGWELIMTFLLIMVVYAVAVHRPGFGNIGPLAVGFTLFASAFVGGPMTGAALNPARVLGPAMVYRCYWSTVPVYIIAQYMAACVSALMCLPVYGAGPFASSGPTTRDPESIALATAATRF